jgi:nicotinamidase-related amidase
LKDVSLHDYSIYFNWEEKKVRTALLVIDMQKHYVFASEEKTRIALKVVECINFAIDLFRKKELPIICIQHMDSEEDVVPGTERFNNIEQLTIVSSDIHIMKTYGNAFNKTNLEKKLKELDVDTIILTGYCAEYCVLSTYRGALDLDITPIILRNAIVSGIPENIRFVESINEVISLGSLQAALS